MLDNPSGRELHQRKVGQILDASALRNDIKEVKIGDIEFPEIRSVRLTDMHGGMFHIICANKIKELTTTTKKERSSDDG